MGWRRWTHFGCIEWNTEATLNDFENIELENAIRNAEFTEGHLVNYGEHGLHFVDSNGGRYKIREHKEGLLDTVGDILEDVL